MDFTLGSFQSLQPATSSIRSSLLLAFKNIFLIQRNFI